MGKQMKTIFDWLSVALFSPIAILFLIRSARPDGAPDRMIMYLPAALGCAIGNQLGNRDQVIAGGMMLAAVGIYSMMILKPGQR